MALQEKCNFKEVGLTSVDLYDTAKIYSPTNITGWEFASNGFIADVTAATMTLTPPDATTLMPGTSVINLGSVLPTLPNVINTPLNKTNADLGYGTGNLPDGWWVLNYSVSLTVTGTPTTKVAQANKILYGQAACCVAELQERVDVTCGCKDNESVNMYLYAKTLLAGVRRNAGCNKNARAIELLQALQKVCRGQNCNC